MVIIVHGRQRELYQKKKKTSPLPTPNHVKLTRSVQKLTKLIRVRSLRDGAYPIDLEGGTPPPLPV